jgi:hypothetical protein
MKFEETILTKMNDNNTFKSIANENVLTLCDPITQLCKRIEAFFKADSDISCRYAVNNSHGLGPKIDPDTGEPYTKQIVIGDETITAIIDEDHICEFRIFVNDYEKAQCLSNVIRHRHVIPETYEAASDGQIHLRNHYLLVRVYVINAIDPHSTEAGSDPWISDDDTSQGLQEIFGLEPINWEVPESQGCYDRLAPTSTSTEDIPKGAPDEYEQVQWEADEQHSTWKWKWLQKALKGNKNITKTYDIVTYPIVKVWKFIECSYKPVVFSEDNLNSSRGYNSILPADLLPLIFAIFNDFQVSTYVHKE